MSKMLIDIDANVVESLEESLRAVYSFDSILGVEPSSRYIRLLLKFKEDKFSFYKFAFSKYNGRSALCIAFRFRLNNAR